jgi:predicted PurR-regulated permease PerM
MSEQTETMLRAAPSPTEEAPAAPIDVNARNVSLTILAAAAAIYILHWAQEVFIPVVLAILISYALSPVVAALHRIKMPRMIAAALVVAAVSGAVGYGIYSLSDDVTSIVAQLPNAAQRLRQIIRRDGQPQTITQVKKAAEELQKTAEEATGPAAPAARGVQRVQIVQPAFNLRDYLSWGSASIVTFVGQALLVMFFAFFLLASGDLFKRKLVKIAGPSLTSKKITLQILNEIDLQIERFLFVRVVTSTVVGVASGLVFAELGLEQAALWGVLAGVFNSIPYFGPIIVAGGTAVVAFLQFGTLKMALYVSGASVVITSLEGWLLTPWLTSRTSRTNEVAIFVALMFWGFIWGIWGTLLAVPMLVATKAVCDHVEDLKPLGELLGE